MLLFHPEKADIIWGCNKVLSAQSTIETIPSQLVNASKKHQLKARSKKKEKFCDLK